ncbi:MAG: T9SS type A sorting domain-containing protein [Bacteroidetes bacterium]|nr:MAG: T9SS type A sorting domain-containing protein [Bacteroidota bacterium]
MHKKKLSVFSELLISSCLFAQTYTGAGGAVSDNLDTTYFSINVTGLNPSVINTAFGLEEICINLTHTKDRDLDIYLESPDGTIIELTTDNGDLGDNYFTACFRQDAITPIVSGTAPFNGSYIPEQQLSILNNWQNGNGIWKLRVYDDNNTGGNTGNLIDWRLMFGNNPAALVPLDSTNLPIVVINTNNQNIPDEPKITCDMGIIFNGIGVKNHLADPFNNYKGKIAIEIRGSSSQNFPKKSYGFETRNNDGTKKDTSLLGMPSEHDWILSASYTDKTHIRNVLSYKFYRDWGRYASRTKYCELVLNGQYQGVYILMERIKRDKNRVDIAKLNTWENAGDSLTGGYIIKLDKPTGNPGGGWTTATSAVYLQYEYPDPDSISLQQQDYIRQYVDSFETALSGPNFADPVNGYAKYCDPNSFMDYFILTELSRNIDGYNFSMYLYKDKFSKGGKLTIGPPWDFDIAWLNANYAGSPTDTGWYYSGFPFWWGRFGQDTNLINQLKCRWLQLRSTVLDIAYINTFIDSTAGYLTEGINRNFKLWPIIGVYVWPNPSPIPTSYQGEIDRLKQWISNRIAWMDANMPGNCLTTAVAENSSNKDISVFPNPSSGKFTIQIPIAIGTKSIIEKTEVFDLFGRKIALLPANSSSLSIDLSTQPSGIYILKIYSGESVILSKIIKAD